MLFGYSPFFPPLILSPYYVYPPLPLGQTDLTNIDKAISEAEATDEQGKAKARRVSIDIHKRFDADGDGEVCGAVSLHSSKDQGAVLLKSF